MDILSIVAAVTGFIMIGLIWWIYYDSFPINERIKSMTNGFPMLYSHLFLAMGFVIMANVIRHAILNDLNMNEFRILAITGMSFFYIGKQTVYIVFIPPFRKRMTINTLVCIFYNHSIYLFAKCFIYDVSISVVFIPLFISVFIVNILLIPLH